MDYRQLNASIKKKNFSGVYLFESSDEYISESMLKALRKGLVDDTYADFNYTVFSEKKINFDAVQEISDTQPFFDDNRLIVIKGEGIKNKGFQKSMREYLTSLPEYSHFVFYVKGKMDKRTALYKYIKKSGVIVELDRFSEYQLEGWLRAKFKREGITLTPKAMSYFIEASGYCLKESRVDLGYFAGEIEKIKSLEKEELDVDEIRKTVSVNIEDNIFNLADALNDRNASRAFLLYSDLRYHNVNFMQILSVVSGNLERLFICKHYRKHKRTERDIVKDYSMHSYAVQRANANSRKYTYAELKNAIRLCFDLDRAIKSGEMSQESAGVLLIEKIANRRRG